MAVMERREALTLSGEQLSLPRLIFDYPAVATAADIAANATNAQVLASPVVARLNAFARQPQVAAGPRGGLLGRLFPSDLTPSCSSAAIATGPEGTGRCKAGSCSSSPTLSSNPPAWHDTLTLCLVILFLLSPSGRIFATCSHPKRCQCS